MVAFSDLAHVRIAKVGKRGFRSCRAVPCQVRARMRTASHFHVCTVLFAELRVCVQLPDADCTLAIPFNVRPSVDARHEPRPSHEGEMLPREAATSIISIMHEACIDHSHGNLSG